MSLISFKNLVAPLHNKLHVGAIIVVAILVAAARYSGASLSSRNAAPDAGQTVEESQVDETDQSIKEFLSSRTGSADPSARAALGRDKGNAPKEDDFLNSLMKQDPNAKKPVAKKQESADGGLNDIKRSLGLE